MRLRRNIAAAALVLLTGCGGSRNGGTDRTPTAPADPTWDIDARGVPQFVTAHYLDLARIARISRFRSGVGHSFTDGTESCRSMKHYFEPRSGTDWATVPIFSPVVGTVRAVLQQGPDTKITIEPSEYPAFWFEVFHVRLAAPLEVGARLTAGQTLGTHIGEQTYSDVAVTVRTAAGMRLVSWFQTLTDTTWQAYGARGAATRDAFIISKAARDSDPLSCAGEAQFPQPGTIPNWVTLN